MISSNRRIGKKGKKDMRYGRALNLFLAGQILVSEQNKTALQNDCIGQNEIQKGKIWQQSHSTGCVAEYGESHCSEMK